MKVVIYTQYRENYGSASDPYWKNKGGDTYVVENMDTMDSIQEEVFGLIEYSNDMAREGVVATDIVADDKVVCDEWESPIHISKVGDRWVASVVHKNDGQFRDEIASKSETWTMLPESGRRDYTAVYTMVEGQVLSEAGLIEMLKLKEA